MYLQSQYFCLYNVKLLSSRLYFVEPQNTSKSSHPYLPHIISQTLKCRFPKSSVPIIYFNLKPQRMQIAYLKIALYINHHQIVSFYTITLCSKIEWVKYRPFFLTFSKLIFIYASNSNKKLHHSSFTKDTNFFNIQINKRVFDFISLLN